VQGSVGLRNFYFGVHTLIPITLGNYIGVKFVSPFYNYDKNTTFIVTMALIQALTYPFIFIQTKMMCEVTSVPAKRRYYGLNDICRRIPYT
jgi:hypothetical protein